MRSLSPILRLVWLGPFIAGLVSASGAPDPPRAIPGVEFARDVQPILKAHCLQCHSGAAASSKLDLSTRDSILKGGFGGPVVVPGKSAESVLVKRLLGQGDEDRMPLGFAPLSDKDIATIRAWIDEGALAGKGGDHRHWAYVPPVQPKVPVLKDSKWVRNPIDAFVLARLAREGLKPSPEADRTTLVRRVTLDLTGLPPTPKEVDAFLADRSPNAYDKVVDRLLASPHYGEKMALPWLDAARYADSNGFQQDGDTFQYVWRDWVVRAINADMPFDEFTVEQLAGDLLPNPSRDQVVATAFNRLHMLNGEGGAIPEEQRNVVLFDRVDVTATTWMGLTMACARCHDHKYDPLSQRDYYSLLAYFNNVPETGVPPGGGQYRIADPWVYAGTDEQMKRLATLKERLAWQKVNASAVERSPETTKAFTQWKEWVKTTSRQDDRAKVSMSPWSSLGTYSAGSFDEAFDKVFEPETKADLKGAPSPELEDGKVHPFDGDNTAWYLARTVHCDVSALCLLLIGSDDGIKVWNNGRLVLSNKVTRGAAPGQEQVRVQLDPGENRLTMKIVNGGGIGGFVFELLKTPVTPDVIEAVRASSTPDSEKRLRSTFLSLDPPTDVRSARLSVKATADAVGRLQESLPRVMVMSDAMPRPTNVFIRGNYEVHGDEVKPGVPAALVPPPKGVPGNRLGLAKWIVSPDNPLTARVQVNRYWQTFFGKGLVKTSENFGVQGELPSHPDLLDWLAVDFRQSGWRVKRLVRMIVTSNTYRQSSRATKALAQKDPENRLLARGARFRMSSLVLRDVALAACGLLDPKIGGKPVYPYQPKDIWDGLAITLERDFTYPQSMGSDLYRRSIYTFWRRTVAPGNMFDASVRQACTVRPSLTSTPMHALTTMNDVTWVEAGRALAERVMRQTGPDPGMRLAEAFRRVCARRPRADELAVLVGGFRRSYESYKTHRADASAYIGVGDSKPDPKLDPAELAAYASVCLVILNLDEALTRE